MTSGANSAHGAGRPITFLSWNVRGLGKSIKLNKVLSHLDNLGAEIAFIQETHLNSSDHVKIQRRWVSQAFHSMFNSKAEGLLFSFTALSRSFHHLS